MSADRTRKLSPFRQLHNGDHLSREEFHSIYETAPPEFRAELIDGVVFVRQSLGRLHAKTHASTSTLLGNYAGRTPGVELCDSASVFLSSEDEVQPDLLLRIIPQCKGATIDTYDNYIEGAPELVVEVAHSSRAIDLFKKRARYAKFGVQEYLVFCLEPAEIYWFDITDHIARRLEPVEGIYKSRVFPGLWIDASALLKLDYEAYMAVLEAGIKSPEHIAFVERLKDRQHKNI